MDSNFEIANLTIRPDEFEVLLDGRRVGLTRREFDLFMVLAQRPDRVVQRAEIYSLIWGGTMRKRDRAVDVLVRKVRGKLTRVAPDWRYIHTHFGIGYRFAPERVVPTSGNHPPTIRNEAVTHQRGSLVPAVHANSIETV